MQTVVTKKIKALERALSSSRQVVRAEAVAHQKLIAQLNREQLSQGIKSDNTSMPDYKDGSKSPNAPGPIQLFDTGDFHAGIEPLFESKEITMLGVDPKSDLLAGKYGKNIFGLTPENIQLLRMEMLPGIIRRFKKML